MKMSLLHVVGVLVILALAAGSSALASGGKNAYNNPSGSPADDGFEMPYVNYGDGRVLVQCADDETLMVIPDPDQEGVEIVCAPAEGE